MPATKLRLFRDDDGSTPILEWLAKIESRNRKAYEKCRSYLHRLAEFGRELRRPTADYLRDGVYELRIKHLRVNYRILYGFVGSDVVLVIHGLTKEQKVPSKEIEVAAERIGKYRGNPDKYCSIDSEKGSSIMQEEDDGEDQPVDPAFQQMYDCITSTINSAHDEPIGSPQYEKMAMLFDVMKLAFVQSGAIPVIDPDNVPIPDTTGTINPALMPKHSNALQRWFDFYLAAITNVCPD